MTRTASFLTLALTAPALLAIAAPAFANNYDIKLDGYCDRLKFQVVHGKLTGASIGKVDGVPCDNAYITGTMAIAAAPVMPNGSIAAASSDFGQSPVQFITYISLGNNTFTIYGTPDGHAMFSISGTWSAVGTGSGAKIDARAADASTEPPITRRFFDKASPVKADP